MKKLVFLFGFLLLFFSSFVYASQCLSGNCYNGYGLEEGTTPDGMTYQYEGDFTNGLKNGIGIIAWSNGDQYEGEWVMGWRTGLGTYTWANGNRYDGQWLNNVQTGQGTLIYADGTTQNGLWQGPVFMGGVFYDPYIGRGWRGSRIDFYVRLHRYVVPYGFIHSTRIVIYSSRRLEIRRAEKWHGGEIRHGDINRRHVEPRREEHKRMEQRKEEHKRIEPKKEMPKHIELKKEAPKHIEQKRVDPPRRVEPKDPQVQPQHQQQHR